MLRSVALSDAEAISRIYNHYILNTTITFEEAKLSTPDIENRIKTISEKYPWYVYETNGNVVGYAYASCFKNRSAYDATVETSLYVDPDFVNAGIGSILYNGLLEKLRALGFHVAMAIITVPNIPSIRLHKRLGFELVGCLKEVGFKFNKRLDVEYWQLFL